MHPTKHTISHGRGVTPVHEMEAKKLARLLQSTAARDDEISIAKYVRVILRNIKCSSVTCVMRDGIWTTFSHPSLPSHNGTWECPYAPRATSYPRQ
mmetsp:Transcript_53974/g.79138  ORF Transcript_53974/g.79138 Transcript_53974/m.79138 type:complete len:96 (-) Transcript_53974:77-364(-)